MGANGDLPADLGQYPDSAVANAWAAKYGGKIAFYTLESDPADSTGATKKAVLGGYWAGTAPYRNPYTGALTPSSMPPQYRAPDAKSGLEIFATQGVVAEQPDWDYNPLRGVKAISAEGLEDLPFDVGNTLSVHQLFDVGVPGDSITVTIDASGNATLANEVLTAVKKGTVVVQAVLNGHPDKKAEVTLTVQPFVDKKAIAAAAAAKAAEEKKEAFERAMWRIYAPTRSLVMRRGYNRVAVGYSTSAMAMFDNGPTGEPFTVTADSSGNAVITNDEFKAVKAGPARLTARFKYNDEFYTFGDMHIVPNIVEEFSLSTRQLDLRKGQANATITAVALLPLGATITTITLVNSDDGVATATSTGSTITVSPKGEGTTVLTVQAGTASQNIYINVTN